MANRIETARDYLVRTVKRIGGLSAWDEAMQRPPGRHVPYGERPAWSRGINKALAHGAPINLILEFGWPAASRLLIPAVYNEGPLKRSDELKIYGLGPAAIMDILTPIYVSVSLAHNPLDLLVLKLATNAAIHVGLDMASVVGKGAARLYRHFRPPTAPTLAV